MSYPMWGFIIIYLVSSFALFLVASENPEFDSPLLTVVLYIATYLPVINTCVIAVLLLKYGWKGTFVLRR